MNTVKRTQIEGNPMGRERSEIYTQFWLGCLKGTDHLE